MQMVQSLLSRRAALTALASAPTILAAAPRALAQTTGTAQATGTPPVALMPACTLTPAAIAGPYYFDPKLQRSDITEGHPGAPLRLRFVVMDAADCTPVSGARIDVWHDAGRRLLFRLSRSGRPAQCRYNGRHLHARDPDRGRARRSVVRTLSTPAGMIGRTVHIHFKIFIDDKRHADRPDVFPRCAEPIYLRQCRRLSAQGRPQRSSTAMIEFALLGYDARRLLRHQGGSRPAIWRR